MPSKNIATEGIILHKTNFGEYDQYITFYSPTLGKIEAIAKGSRKISSPFLGHLETLNICKFQLYKSLYAYTIIKCQAVHSFKEIRSDFDKSAMAILFSEIFHKTAHSHEQTQNLFELLKESLTHLSQSNNHSLCLEAFKIKLLSQLGLLPEIKNCSICHRKWNEDSLILISEDGHLSCQHCRFSNTSYRTINFMDMKLINFIGTAGFGEIEKIIIPQPNHTVIKKFGDLFLNHFTGKEMLSESLVQSL
ncbi:MAG TPA: DNA repair protein RecO [Candidatus Gracilibacteria bacterium]|nr:DNA repair protein RecO [Candidatus Gracilibacteria bacterium]